MSGLVGSMPELDPQRPALGELLGEPPLGQHVDRAGEQRRVSGASRRRRLRGAMGPMLDSRAGSTGYAIQLTVRERAPRGSDAGDAALAQAAGDDRTHQRVIRVAPTTGERPRRVAETAPDPTDSGNGATRGNAVDGAAACADAPPAAATAAPGAAGPTTEEPRTKPRLKKLRFALVILGLALLAFVSWIFGIMMAVAQDLPVAREPRSSTSAPQNSVVYDVNGDQARDADQQPGPDPRSSPTRSPR